MLPSENCIWTSSFVINHKQKIGKDSGFFSLMSSHKSYVVLLNLSRSGCFSSHIKMSMQFTGQFCFNWLIGKLV